MLSSSEPVPDTLSTAARDAVTRATHVDQRLYDHALARFHRTASQFSPGDIAATAHNIARVRRELESACDDGVGVALCMWYNAGDRAIASLLHQHGEVEWG